MRFAKQIKRLVNAIVKAILADTHTNIPARVVSYDPVLNTCKIQLCFLRMRTDDPDNLEPIQSPQIDDVPVKQMGSGKLLLSVAPQVDSYGEFRVSERSMERWLNEGGAVLPASTRMHHLSDGVFDPGLYPFVVDGDNGKLQSPIATDRMSLRTRDGVGQVSMLDDGSVIITLASGKTVKIDAGTDAAALASLVDSYISKMDLLIRTTWVPPVAPTIDNGAALKTGYITAFPSAPGSTASQQLKVES